MARYEAAVRTTITTATAATPLAALRAITRPAWLRELHIQYVTAGPASASGLALIPSTAIGTGALTGLIGLAVNPSDLAGTAEAITNWGTAIPTNAGLAASRRRWLSGSTTPIGTALVWIFEAPGFYVPGSASATSEILLCNMAATAPGTMDLTWVYEE
jgi:hypothetical protein